MKKMILLASAALAFSTVASAQDSTMAPPTGTTNPDAASAPTGAPDMGAQPPADQGGMQTAPGMPGSSGAMTAPGTDSATGATGEAPGGGSPPTTTTTAPGSATGPNGPVSMTPTQGPTDLPTCSKTVTDNCKQGAGKSGGAHRASKHRRH